MFERKMQIDPHGNYLFHVCSGYMLCVYASKYKVTNYHRHRCLNVIIMRCKTIGDFDKGTYEIIHRMNRAGNRYVQFINKMLTYGGKVQLDATLIDEFEKLIKTDKLIHRAINISILKEF